MAGGHSRRTESAWCVARLCLALALLASAACRTEPEAAASSALRPAPATASFEETAEPPDPSTKPSQPASPANIGGTWLARFENRSFTLELILEDQGLRGFVRAADGSVTPIKIGVFSGDAFLFETGGASTGWLWSGEISSSGMRGHRENVQTGVVEEFTAERPE